jgi:PhnB protein
MPTSWKPDNWPTLTPALPGGARLIDFLMKAFEAQPLHVYETENRKVARAEIRIGDSLVITGDPVNGRSTPPGSLLVYVADCDAAYQRAIKAGATSKQAPADQFFGDRTAYVVDPFGNQWSIATHKEDVSAAEMAQRLGR